MARILYTAFDVVPSPKGASTHITFFIRGLVAAGHTVTLITAGTEHLPPTDTYAGATILRAPVGEDMNFLRRAVAFGEFVRAHLTAAEPYDLVHFRSVWSGLPLVEMAAQQGYRSLYEVNGLPSVEMKYHYPALRRGPTLAKIAERERLTLAGAEAVICPARVTRDYLLSRGVPEDKITVIPNGVAVERFAAAPEVEPQEPPVILYVGTLTDWQGLDNLLTALPLILTAEAVQVWIVGPSRKRQHKRLRKRAVKLGVVDRVRLLPPVPHADIPALMKQASVAVAPLAYNDRNVVQGCCPLKVLEYMAAGRPVVASNLPVVRELVRPDIEALLFDPADPADLARQILRLLQDPALAAGLAVNGLERVRTDFRWTTAQARLLRVYGELGIMS